MTLLAFREMVKDFLKRKNLTDAQLDRNINLAKMRLQRDYALNVVAKKKTLTYPSAGGGVALGSDFRAFYDDFSVVILNGAGGSTPIRGSTFNEEQRRLRDDQRDGVSTMTSIETREIHFYCMSLDGEMKLFLNPEIADAILEVYMFAFLPDYSADGDEDILLTVGRDAMLWETLKVCNMFLVEEERVKIDSVLANEALSSLQAWAARAVTSGSTMDLA